MNWGSGLRNRQILHNCLTPVDQYMSTTCIGFSRRHANIDLFNYRNIDNAKDLYRFDIKGHSNCVNTIEFSSKDGCYFASGGDDCRVFLWDTYSAITKGVHVKPHELATKHEMNVFSLAFNCNDSTLYSGGIDLRLIEHDIATGNLVRIYDQDCQVLSLSSHPDKCGNLLASTKRSILMINSELGSTEVLVNFRKSSLGECHSVMYNPVNPYFFATAHMRGGVRVWDQRMLKQSVISLNSGRYGMSARWDSSGTRLAVLSRRQGVSVYNLGNDEAAVLHLEAPSYYNSITLKSCCWVDDMYVLSGSDDFCVYLWKVGNAKQMECRMQTQKEISVNDANLELRGHLSIVNQVRYNPFYHLFLSCGIEHSIKAWSTFPLPASEGNLLGTDRASVRPICRHTFLNRATNSENHMLDFFDDLLRREECRNQDTLPNSDDSNSEYEPLIFSRNTEEALLFDTGSRSPSVLSDSSVYSETSEFRPNDEFVSTKEFIAHIKKVNSDRQARKKKNEDIKSPNLGSSHPMRKRRRSNDSIVFSDCSLILESFDEDSNNTLHEVINIDLPNSDHQSSNPGFSGHQNGIDRTPGRGNARPSFLNANGDLEDDEESANVDAEQFN